MVWPGAAGDTRPRPPLPTLHSLLLMILLLVIVEIRPLPQQLNQQQYRQRRHVQQDVRNSSCSLRQLCPAQHCLHGICIDTGNGGECFCEDGYTGLYCETDADDCLSAPCRHGGTCSDLVRGYSCDCPPGYTGDSCQSLVRGCEEARCLNGASCVYAHHGIVACLCPPGFRGVHCETDISVCRHVAPPHVRCHHGGRCLDGPANTYHCQCRPGYTGATCLVDVNECASSPCQNGGSCIDQINDFQCVCQPGFSGRLCQTALQNCEVNVCENGGLCVLNETGPACLCRPDFHGERCQRRYDDCQPRPRCLHGGSCVDEINSFRCECPPDASGRYCQCISSENGTYCVAPEHTRPWVAGLHSHLVVTVGYSTVFHTSVVTTEYVEATASVSYDVTTESVTTEEVPEDGAVTDGAGIMPSFETADPGAEATSTPPPTFSPSAGDALTPSAVSALPSSSEVDQDVLSSPREPKDLPRTPAVSVEDTPLQTVPKTVLTSPTLPLPVTASPSIVITSPGISPTSPVPSEVIPTSPSPSPLVSSDLISTSLVIPSEYQVPPFTESTSTTEETTVDITTSAEGKDDIATSAEGLSTKGVEFYTQTEEVSAQTEELTTQAAAQTELGSTRTETSTTTEESFTQAEEVSSTSEKLPTRATGLPTHTEEISTQTERISTQTEETSTQPGEMSTQRTSLATHVATEQVASTPLTTSEEPSPSDFITGATTVTDEFTTRETLTGLDTTTEESTTTFGVTADESSTTPYFVTEEPSPTSHVTTMATEITSEFSTEVASTASTHLVTEETPVTLEYVTTDSSLLSAFTTEVSSRPTDVTTEEETPAVLDITTEVVTSTTNLTTDWSATPDLDTTTEPITFASSTEEISTSSDFGTQTVLTTFEFTSEGASMTSDLSTEHVPTVTESTREEAPTKPELITEGTSILSEGSTRWVSSTSDSTIELLTTPSSTSASPAPDSSFPSTPSSSAQPPSFTPSVEEPSSATPGPGSVTTSETPTTTDREMETAEMTSVSPTGTTEASPPPDRATTEVAPPSLDTPTTEVAPPSLEEVTSDLLPIRFFPETYLLLESDGAEGSPGDLAGYEDIDLMEEVLSDERHFLGDGLTTGMPLADADNEDAKQEKGEGGQTNSFTEDAKRVAIKISFATLSEDGVVLSSLPAGVPPWYRLFLSGGLLRLAFACSGLQATSFIETQAKVNTGRRVTVQFVLRWLPGPSPQAAGSCRAAMRVAGSPVTVAQQFADRPLDRRVALVVGSQPAEPGFSGYLLQLQVNGRRFDDLSLIVAESVGASRSPCDEADCRHNSTCRQITWMEVSCLCRPGFSGARCEEVLCDPAPCGPGGQCALLATGSPVCLCPFGKTGQYCQEETTFPGSRYRFHGSTGGLSSALALNVSGSLRHQFWMFFHLTTNDTRQTSLLALLTDSIPESSAISTERMNMTITLNEFSDKNAADEAKPAALSSSNTNTALDSVEAVLEPTRPWREVQGDFFAVTLSRGYVTVTWHLGSGSKRLMSEAPLDPEMTVQTVRVGRRDRRVWLQVNAQRVVTALAPGDYTKLDVLNVLHIGGYSGATQHLSELPADLSSYRGFIGCVFDLRLGLDTYRGVPLTVTRGRNVTPCRLDQCQGLYDCPASPPARSGRVSRRSP